MGNGSEPRFSFGLKMLDSAIRPAIIALFAANAPAQVAELVDAHGSGPCAARRGGSSPLLGTKIQVRSNPKKSGNPVNPCDYGGFCFGRSHLVQSQSGVFMNTGFGCNVMPRVAEPNSESESAFRNAKTRPKDALPPTGRQFLRARGVGGLRLGCDHPQEPA